MNIKKGRRLASWALVLMMLISTAFPTNEALAATPSSLDATVNVTGVEDGGTIDGSEEVHIGVTFPVPVKGDGGNDFYEYGDTVELLLSESFYFGPVPTEPIKLHDPTNNKLLGHVSLSNNDQNQAIATITFDGDKDIFDPEHAAGSGWTNVSGTFEADLMYNGTSRPDGSGNKIVSILNKTYQLQLPDDTITYRLEKQGAVNMTDGTITWTVEITAEQYGADAPVSLEGYTFKDNLASVGTYVAGSFSLTGGTLTTPNDSSSELTYTFPSGSASPQTITFETNIPADTVTKGGSITNEAGLYQDATLLDTGTYTANVTLPEPLVEKEGVATESDGDLYDPYDSEDPTKPTDRYITWYITVDNNGRTLKDLTITDELNEGLQFVSAQWQKQVQNETWSDIETQTWELEPNESIYSIGTVDYVGRLKIVTRVYDDFAEVVSQTMHKNQANVEWTYNNNEKGSATATYPGVWIGYDALGKWGEQVDDDVANHQITWTLDVDMKGQTATGFTVYDLFVHDENTSDEDLTEATGWPNGLSIGSGNITRNNGQKFIDVDSNPYTLTVTTTKLMKEDKHIATLVAITGLQNSGSNRVDLKSQVLDPDIIAGNNPNQTVKNYASLYKDTTFRASAGASVNYNNKILSKELLNRDEVDNDHNPDAAINPNNSTTNAADGFHYGYKEVIFRLNVNAANVDFANVRTTLDGGFGDVTVTDTLPEGWEFVPFSEEQDYLIYNGAGISASVDALGVKFNRDADPQTAEFTFKTLNKPYVILVKARPTDESFDGYLKGANTRDETNTLSLVSSNWKPGKTVTQTVTVDSTLLSKSHDLAAVDGSLTWTVNYTPFEREIGTGLEDTLPEGIDLRTDSSGQLIWEENGTHNINVSLLTLNENGSGAYTPVETPLTLEELKSSISYDNNSRMLTFNFPDKTQAYRMTYVTDITGTPGTVTNTVNLVDAEGNGTTTGTGFNIAAQHGSATMSRSGYLVVKKADRNSTPLEGAEFTLYNTNADGSKASTRAVRTTGADGIVKFYGLAPGSYILVETKAPADYENPSLNYHVTVAADKKTTVDGSNIITSGAPFVVSNYKADDPVGSLTISKAVAGNAADAEKVFQFTLTFDDMDGIYTYVGQGVPGGTIQSGDTVSLAHGQSITVVGLPTGAAYTVTEADYSKDGYSTVSTGATGTISTNTTRTASFTNTKNWYPSPSTGALTISKTVTGEGADLTKKFDFTVTFEGASGSYSYTGAQSGRLRSGDTVSLAHGESITITGLPKGAEYTVTEGDYSDLGYVSESTGESGTISANRDRTAAFTNEKQPGADGALTIRKTVTGEGADLTKKFDFTVTLTGAPDEYPCTGTESGTIRSGDTISLAHGESATITRLPAGTAYTVTEADYSAENYASSSTGASGEISANALQTAAFTNALKTTPADPTTPTTPGTPGDPDDTVNIGGDVPTGSMEGEGDDTVNIDGDVPTGSMNGGKDGMPKTGDQSGSNAKSGLLFFSAALGTLALAEFILRKTYRGKREKK